MPPKTLSRADTSILGRWWWTIDRWALAALMVLIAMGVILSFAGSPPVADRLNLGGFFFVKRHIMMLVPSIAMIFFVSLFPPRQIRRLAFFIYLIGIAGLIITLFYGTEIKGARRWIMIAGTSIQASEFVKPAFIVLAAWMLSEKAKNPHFPGFFLSLGLLGLYVLLLLAQPDLGMTVIAVASWIGILFVAGLRVLWLGLAGGFGLFGLGVVYLTFPHVRRRIDQFWDPQMQDPSHDLYQIQQSLEAFANGGLLGRGPGEGVVKKHLPDAHADFIFAVAGEEFGLIICLVLLGLFLFIILRSLVRVMNDNSIFAILATSGLLIQFGLQSLINMASSLHMIPTKGMTMPFVSYGGSSMIALAIAMGMVLALTRKRHGQIDWV